MRENKCHLRLVNCLSASAAALMRCVLGVRQERCDITVGGSYWRSVHAADQYLWAIKTSQNDMRSVVAGAGSGGFGASEKASDPVWLLCKLHTHVCNAFPCLWFAAFKRTFVSEGNMNGAFAEWSACSGLWFCPFDACIDEKRSCARWLHARVFVPVHYIRLMNVEQMTLKW